MHIFIRKEKLLKLKDCHCMWNYLKSLGMISQPRNRLPGMLAQKMWLLEDLQTVNPLAGETFYLRMLLHHDHCRGKDSFADLRILDNGEQCETYKEVCREPGLLKDDQEWHTVLEESAITKLCPQICELFVVILMFC